MATVNRWSPFDEVLSLRDAMGRLFEESYVAPTAGNRTLASVETDIHESQEGYLIEAAVPGLKPQDLEITLHDNVLTLSGEFHASAQPEGVKTHRTERRYGQFTRSFSLPSALRGDGVTANLDNGVLLINVPKAEEARPRKINVAIGSTGQHVLESGK